MKRLLKNRTEIILLKSEVIKGKKVKFARDKDNFGREFVYASYNDNIIANGKTKKKTIIEVKKHFKRFSIDKNITNNKYLNSDFDKDGVINKKDCRPFDKNKQHEYEQKELSVNPRIYKGFEILRYGKEMGLSPKDTHQHLKDHGFAGDDMRSIMMVYHEYKKGVDIVG